MNKIKMLPLLNILIMVVCLIKGPLDRGSLLSLGVFALLTLALVLALFKPFFRRNNSDSAEGASRGGKTASVRMVNKFMRNKSALTGLIILLVIIYLAILAPFAAPYNPDEIDWSALIKGPSAEHWMGTDELGRDVFSRVLYGYRVALTMGLAAVILNSILGTVLGMIAGFYGGKTDTIIMRALELWDSIPFILLAISIMAAFGTGLLKLIIVVSLSGVLSFARIIRGSVLLLKEQDYISAGRVIGFPGRYLIFRHILPNCLAPVIVMASLRIGETILTVAGLSFLGLGIQPPMSSLGFMLSTSQQYLSQNVFMSLFPGLAILLIVLSMNLFGDGLRDALDSRLSD